MSITTKFIFLFALTSFSWSGNGSPEDVKAVEQALLDYVEGIYEVDPQRIERSVSKDLIKLGYWRDKDKQEYGESTMSFKRLMKIAATWNKKGRVDPKTAIKEIKVFSVHDKTAAGMVRAHWGIDYMQLVKKEGRWRTVHILWQSVVP